MSLNNQSFSDCPISQPIFRPDEESVQFNGFAWSNRNGIVLQSNYTVPGDSNTWFTGQ